MSSVDEDTGAYRLKRLYRATHGTYFVLDMQWSGETGFDNPDFIQPINDDSVLRVARFITPARDCMRFFCDWYCAGWIPRNDVEAQKWAEFCLSADDCETVMVEFTNSIAACVELDHHQMERARRLPGCEDDEGANKCIARCYARSTDF